MANRAPDSDSSDYGYDLTAEEEDDISAIVDHIARSSSQQPAPTPAPPVESALHGITEEDLSFDISELESETLYTHNAPDPEPVAGSSQPGTPRGPTAGTGPNDRRLSPSVSGDSVAHLAPFVQKTKPRSMPTAIGSASVRYPDLSRALSNVPETASGGSAAAILQPARQDGNLPAGQDTRSPILRFRTFPMKPFSVSDLTAGSWCELQYYYTLTRLPGGRKTRTAAMKRGSEVHEKLEREVYTPVAIDVRKREDAFGLKVWNIIQGLRTLRDNGLARELEVWGLIDGNVVNGIIDGLSYENPDPELEEDVVSSRGGSQSSQQAGVSEFFPTGTAADKMVFITDVKTRATKTPPSQTQVRGTIIQLFLYHRFLSEMASDKLDYVRVFERYGLNVDEAFSDAFMAQIGALHEEIFAMSSEEEDADTSINTWSTNSEVESAATTDYVSAISSPLKLADTTIKYRTLRALLPLLKFEIQLTFPKGASSVGQIVAVEYRYRQRGRRGVQEIKKEEDDEEDDDEEAERKRRNGSVICVNSHFVEQEILDLYLKDNMQWWRGEREPRGVALDEAFKCRTCEFIGDCEWRDKLDQEALRKAKASAKQKGMGKGNGNGESSQKKLKEKVSAPTPW
ncbi:exonuclease V [Apodospora peruviana]|uniref:Exonuclease V n=1 Tax=Apodospora peruviana TaxID=516989 RepID=A0AAE0I5I5_9PEZI|nr:exonuclease V [Apodospora peruviana]